MSGNSFPLHNAVITRNLAEIEKLTAASDVDINERDAAGMPPLHYAIHLGYIDIMKYLISKGKFYTCDTFGSEVVNLNLILRC